MLINSSNGIDLAKIGVPYLRAKAQDYYESLGGGIDPDLLDEGGSYQAARALADDVSRVMPSSRARRC